MSIFDQLGGILNQYSSGNAQPGPQATQHFEQVATQIPQSSLASMLTNVFQSPETGTFGQNISQMYGQSNPQQQAGILNRLLPSVSPGLLGSLGLGGLTSMLGGGGAAPQISPQQAQQVNPGAVEQLANHAQQQNPGIVQQAGEFYSQHPTLVKALGAGAAVWALRNFSAQS